MNDFLSSFLNKISKKVSRRKITKWNKNQIKLDLLKLEERLVPAPNLLVPTTTAGAPLGFVQNTNLAFSGALDIELLDTPTPLALVILPLLLQLLRALLLPPHLALLP